MQVELGIFSLDTLAAMKADAIDVATSRLATPERRVAAHEAVVEIDRQLDKNMEWAMQVRSLLDVGVAG